MVHGENLNRAAKRIFGPPVDTVDASKSSEEYKKKGESGNDVMRPKRELRREQRRGWNE